MKNKINFDSFTLGLITGKYQTRKEKITNEDGSTSIRTYEEYVPNIRNDNAPMPQLVGSLGALGISKSDVYIREQLHPKMMVIDYSVFQKSKIDKDILKLTKKAHKQELLKAGKNPKKHMNIFS